MEVLMKNKILTLIMFGMMITNLSSASCHDNESDKTVYGPRIDISIGK